MKKHQFQCFFFYWVILLGLTCLPFQIMQAQHPPMYSQYMFNTMLINPAYTGSRNALSVSVLARKQWVGIKGAPFTQTVALHSPLRNQKNSFGFTFNHDAYGVSENLSVFASYAYRIHFSEKNRLAFGLQAGFQSIQDRWTRLKLDDNIDNVFSADSPVFYMPKAGFGVYYDRENL